MELNMGSIIKKLRKEKRITQEELANAIGVSFQAVSKWENDTTLPDIALLPQLAQYFGVRIDDLFNISREDELKRIDSILEKEQITDENFAYATQILDAILQSNENHVGALKRYAELYLSKNHRDNLTAQRLLRKVMQIAPTDETVYGLYRRTCCGDRYTVQSANDLFIRDCEAIANQHPENLKLTESLIEAMIDQRYFDRALALIEKSELTLPSMAVVWKGDIALAQGDEEGAVMLWRSVDSKDHKGQYEVGERFRRIGHTEEAISAFEHSFEEATVPRDLSAVYSLAFLYAEQNEKEKAIQSWQTILSVLSSDWAMTDGEPVDWANREINKLKN